MAEVHVCPFCGAKYDKPIERRVIQSREPPPEVRRKLVLRRVRERHAEGGSSLTLEQALERAERCLARDCWQECYRQTSCRWIKMLAGVNPVWPACAKWDDPQSAGTSPATS